ncbi:MAG: homocysteine S-methyltransferase family protein [Flavobacteriales bacterium]|jgi:5-methyltetrahydrofolate--homocysteine methyltransferase
MSKRLEEIAKNKILILDGAMGTMIQRHSLSEEDFRGERFKSHHSLIKGNNDLLCLTQPQIIEDIHFQYFEAGADIVETNTFNAQRISLADYDMQELAYEINVEAAKCAIRARENYYKKYGKDTPKFIAGALGPTNKTASLSPDVNDPGYRGVTFDELVLAYKEQAKGLIDGGVDALLVETIFDTLNAKAAFFAIEELFEELGISMPIMASGTITDASGRTLSGQTAQAFHISLSHVPLLSIGFNCALGAEQLKPYVQVLSDECNCLVSAYPNAGLPNAMGHYDQSPEEMAGLIQEYLERGVVNIVGGCCGTTPDHISAIANVAKNFQPRSIQENETLPS